MRFRMSIDEDSEQFQFGYVNLSNPINVPSSPPSPPPAPPSSPVSPARKSAALLSDPIYQPDSAEHGTMGQLLCRGSVLQETTAPSHDELDISPTRPRNNSSVSMSQVPAYMSRGQILPPSGLSSVIFPPILNSSPSDFSPTVTIAGEEGASTDRDASEGVHIGDSTDSCFDTDDDDDDEGGEEEDGPRLPHEMPTPERSLCYRYASRYSIRERSNSDPGLSHAIAVGSYASAEGAGPDTGDYGEDEEDAESGGVLIPCASRKNPVAEQYTGVEKFPTFNRAISESLLTQAHTYGSMPVRKRGRDVLEYKHPLLPLLTQSAASEESGEGPSADGHGISAQLGVEPVDENDNNNMAMGDVDDNKTEA